MSKKQDAAPESHTMTLAEINAFLKKQQAEKAERGEVEPEADKPKRARPAKAEPEVE